ncbi:P-loop containing nucleoside triphosphate hydrolase protein [Sparassis latifolia]
MLADVYRGMFKFGVFNAVQSHCFDSVPPTGSGKTVLFELAIVRMLMRVGGNSGTSKCIYVAPTKALCSEKCRDWTTKFQALGIKCCELTGDTVVFGKGAWGNAKDADGEKWDSLTRHWRDYGQILSQIQLFLVDEVHILNESRGSTLEVIISRMKTRGSSVRFIVVSATVPNIEDVASWIGNGLPGGSAAIKQFGEEFRPCKLTKIVHAYSKKKDLNDFAFQRMLDMKLYSILEQHSVDKPMLVFGTSRKGVVITAEQMLKCYEEAMKKRAKLPWTKPSSGLNSNSTLEFHLMNHLELASFGIGVHHAGMNMDDRRLTEDLYVKKILRILFATSTLAVGVNLPAHTVIIKGVKLFQNNSMQEYSDLDIMQMMGRAGRPQFDKEGVAIIMCETELEGKYKALVQGQMLLESCLHHNLSEHINSEIGLGTITDLDSAKKWLHNSFLFQRIQKNPRHYAIGKDGAQTWQERIGEMVTQSITDLQDNNLVSRPEDGDHQLSSTEFGDIMSKFYIRQSTVHSCSLATVGFYVLGLVKCRLRHIYNKMREHNDIRFQIKKVEKPADKVFMLIQAVLGGLSLSDNEYKNGDNNPTLEAVSVFRHIARIAKAVVEVAIIRRAGAELKNSLETFLLNRRPPFGHEILAHVNSLPQYTLSITELSVTRGGGSKPVEVELSIDVGLVEEGISLKSKKSKGKSADSTVVLTLTSDNDFIDFRRVPTKLLKNSKTFTVSAELVKPSQSIIVQMASTNIAGVSLSKAYRPTLEAKYYPTMNTRPQNAVDLMLEGLEDDPDFWNMGPNDEDIPMKDLTQHRSLYMDYQMQHYQLTTATESEDAVQRGNTRKTPLRPEKAESRGAAVPSTVQLGFKRLSNGNFEYAHGAINGDSHHIFFPRCNHACKDKTKCRHMWYVIMSSFEPC